MSQLTRVDSIVSSSKSYKSRHLEDNQAINLNDGGLIEPTRKRYIILFLYALNSGIKTFQWTQIPISTGKLTFYYNVDNLFINSLSVIFLIAYIALSWPACYLIKKFGLRNAVLIGSFATATGAIIKCFSCHEDGIVYLFAGHTIVALGEQFVFSIPSRLASVWFPDSQVSTAVSMCIFGNQIGAALGYFVPQVLLDPCETKPDIGNSLRMMFICVAIVASLAFLADVLLFDEAPKYAPGVARLRQAQLEEIEQEKATDFVSEMKTLAEESRRLIKNRDFTLLALYYGIFIGADYALSTILNQMLEPIWPGDDILIGNAGLIMVVAGLIGLPLWGRLMDYLHRYKSVTIFLTLATTLSFGLFAYIVSHMHSAAAIYFGAFSIGLFQTGIIATGLEFAVEITYPAPELIASSLMNIQPQVFGTIIIYTSSHIVDKYGAFAVNIFFVCVCLISLIILATLNENSKRQNALEMSNQSGGPNATAAGSTQA